ncbi:MAG: hypothetical protein AAF720_01890 [Pseudomonadota bacterium]
MLQGSDIRVQYAADDMDRRWSANGLDGPNAVAVTRALTFAAKSLADASSQLSADVSFRSHNRDRDIQLVSDLSSKVSEQSAYLSTLIDSVNRMASNSPEFDDKLAQFENRFVPRIAERIDRDMEALARTVSERTNALAVSRANASLSMLKSELEEALLSVKSHSTEKTCEAIFVKVNDALGDTNKFIEQSNATTRDELIQHIETLSEKSNKHRQDIPDAVKVAIEEFLSSPLGKIQSRLSREFSGVLDKTDSRLQALEKSLCADLSSQTESLKVLINQQEKAYADRAEKLEARLERQSESINTLSNFQGQLDDKVQKSLEAFSTAQNEKFAEFSDKYLQLLAEEAQSNKNLAPHSDVIEMQQVLDDVSSELSSLSAAQKMQSQGLAALDEKFTAFEMLLSGIAQKTSSARDGAASIDSVMLQLGSRLDAIASDVAAVLDEVKQVSKVSIEQIERAPALPLPTAPNPPNPDMSALPIFSPEKMGLHRTRIGFDLILQQVSKDADRLSALINEIEQNAEKTFKRSNEQNAAIIDRQEDSSPDSQSRTDVLVCDDVNLPVYQPKASTKYQMQVGYRLLLREFAQEIKDLKAMKGILFDELSEKISELSKRSSQSEALRPFPPETMQAKNFQRRHDQLLIGLSMMIKRLGSQTEEISQIIERTEGQARSEDQGEPVPLGAMIQRIERITDALTEQVISIGPTVEKAMLGKSDVGKE